MNTQKAIINVSLLTALAQTEKDEFTDMLVENFGGNTELASALREIQQQEKAEKTKAAAREIQSLIQHANQEIVFSVNQLRELKAREAQLRAKLVKINRAQDYGYETMNFLPLVALLNNSNSHQVPEDWVAKNPAPKQAVPRKTSK